MARVNIDLTVKKDCVIAFNDDITAVRVDGEVVWPAPKQKVRVHDRTYLDGRPFHFWREDGDYDLYISETGVVYAKPAEHA